MKAHKLVKLAKAKLAGLKKHQNKILAVLLLGVLVRHELLLRGLRQDTDLIGMMVMQIILFLRGGG